MKVRIIPHQRTSAAWNLALEEALFLRRKEDLLKGKEIQPVVKLYSFSKPSVVLGYMQNISEIDSDFCKQVGVDVTMRTTGGGSVYLGKNDMQYSLLLPQNYSKDLLKDINLKIIKALQDVGFHSNLKVEDNHPVIRMENNKHSVFDAQRRFKNLLLHHGTVLVDNFDYIHMPQALKASEENLEDLHKGNLWLRQMRQVQEKKMVRAFNRNLPGNGSFVKKDFTSDEIKLAKRLYKEFYTNPKKFGSGKKKFGICYLPSTEYNMEKYTEKDD